MKHLKAFILILIFALPLTGMFIHLGEFAYPVLSNYSDLAITHYPNAIYLLRSLHEYGQLPLWTNAILSGYPFVANPLAGIWYPFGWLAYLFTLPAGFNLVTGFHLIFGATGMFLLLKKMGLRDLPAVAGGLAVECLPRLWAHSTAGHLTLVYAFCWSPWLLWSEMSSRARLFYLPGIILAMIGLADVRWVAYAGFLWVAFRIWMRLRNKTMRQQGWIAWILETGSQSILGLGLMAALLMPMLEFIGFSTRQDLAISDNLIFSLQPARLLGLIFPDFTGYVEWIIYPGAIAVIAFVWSWLDAPFRRKSRFLRWGIISSILLSMGSFFSPSGWLLSIPGFDLLRVPSRFMLVAGIFLVVLTAHWLDDLLHRSIKITGSLRLIRLGLAGLCVLVLALTIVVGIVNKSPPVSMIGGFLTYFLCTVLIFIHLKKPFPSRTLGLLLVVICLTDLTIMNSVNIRYRPVGEILSTGEDTAKYLSENKGRFRVYSPSYSVPQQVAADFGLELADGIDPLQLKKYIDFFETASGIPQSAYSVTTPPFGSSNPDFDNQDFIPDASQLGLLNVRYISAEFPIQADGLELVHETGMTRIYENLKALPRAWIQDITAPLGKHIVSSPTVEYTPNRIQLAAEGPGLLVLSEINYPGWMVKVDGVESPIVTTEIFRSVELSPGPHTVVFSFLPPSLVWGIGITGSTILFLAINFILRRKNDLSL